MSIRPPLSIDRRNRINIGDLVYPKHRRAMGPFPNYDQEGNKTVTMVREYHCSYVDVVNDYKPVDLTVVGLVKNINPNEAQVEWYGINPFANAGPRTDWHYGVQLCLAGKLEEIEDVPDSWAHKK